MEATPVSTRINSPVWAVVLALTSVYLAWGTTYLAIRVAVESIPPFCMAGGRFLVAGSLLYLISRWLMGASAPTARQWRSAVLIGFLLLTVANGLVSWAETTVPSGLTALIIASTPMMMAVVHWLMGGGRPTWLVGLGLLVGLAGVGLLVGWQVNGQEPGFLWGTLAILISCLSWVFGSLLSQRLPQPESPFLGGAMQMLAAGMIMPLIGLVSGEGARLSFQAFHGRAILAMLWLVVVGSIIGLGAYLWLLRHVPPVLASTYGFVNPVVAVLLGVWLMDEPCDRHLLLAGSMVVVSVVLVVVGRRRRQ